ncbi:uncharacterized protein LOC125316081 [Rhodamnia argentea]|uniref:Uncharacterized protein LOC125316081 n=1 Tax=Rhodamnia argentea TaxID=178133 RepID=A0ABM3HRB3_9MYRT|nr:uncharacterized protein LOC125316081 [Rhodamnia argentea]
MSIKRNQTLSYRWGSEFNSCAIWRTPVMASEMSRASFDHVKLEETGFGAAMFVRRGCAGESKDSCCINIYINSNVQGVSNSILVGSEVRMADPGVSLYFGDIKLANAHKRRRRHQRNKWSFGLVSLAISLLVFALLLLLLLLIL